MADQEAILAEIKRRGLTPPTQSDPLAAAKAEALKRGLINNDSELVSGVKRGLKTTGALITEGVPAVAEGLVNDAATSLSLDKPFDTQDELQAYQAKVEDAYKKYPTKYKSFQDIKDIGSAGGYAASAIGEQIPQVALSMLSGGIGAFAAKQGVAGLARKAGTELTQAQINSAIKKGILSGTLASSASQNIPESYFNLLEKGADEPTKAVLIGALKSGLDVLPEIKVLEKVLGPAASDIVAKSLIKRMAVEGGKTAIGEGVTEAAQEGLDILGEQFILQNTDLFQPDSINRMIDSGLKGAIGGGMMGAGAAPLMTQQSMTPEDYKNLSPAKKAELDQKFTEETIGQATQKNAPVNDSLTDDSILTPLYVPDETLAMGKEVGLRNESLSLLSPDQIKDTHDLVHEAPNLMNIGDFHFTPDKTEKLTKPLTARKSRIKQGLRGVDRNFILGDGEIVAGTPVSDKATIVNPVSQVEVNDIQKLQEFSDRRRVQKYQESLKTGTWMPQRQAGKEINTPEFKDWFNGSKTIDEQGIPKILYTGTSKDTDFKKFNVPRNGVWFSENSKDASDYAMDNDSKTLKMDYATSKYKEVNTKSRVIPAYVSIKNPYTLTPEESQKMRNASNYKKAQSEIFDNVRARGFDGVNMGGGVWVVLKEPSQIKSTFNEKFDKTDPKFQKAKDLDNLGMYSQMNRALLEVMPNKIKPAELKKLLKVWADKGLYKAEELEWSDIEDWVSEYEDPRYLANEDGSPREITKRDLEQMLSYGPLFEVKENERNNEPEPEYDDPLEQRPFKPDTNYARVTLSKDPNDPTYKEFTLTAPFMSGDKYDSGHWDETNVLAHWRQSDKVIDGEKTTFIEEIQSDWHQQGASLGYAKNQKGITNEEAQLLLEKLQNALENSDVRREAGALGFAYGRSALQALHYYNAVSMGDPFETVVAGFSDTNFRDFLRKNKEDFLKLYKYYYSEVGVPNAPFKKTWSQLVLKRILLQAAQEHNLRIAFPKKEAVKEIQSHPDFKAGKFYEERIVNELKTLAKKYGFTVENSTLNSGMTKMSEEQIKNEIREYALDTYIIPNVNNYANQKVRIAQHLLDDGRYFGTYENTAKMKPDPLYKDHPEVAEKIAKDFDKKAKELESKNLLRSYPVTLVKIPPEVAAKIRGEGLPLFQKMTTQFAGNLQEDYLVPQMVANNLYAVQMTPEATKQSAKLIKVFERIVHEVAGTAAKAKTYSYLDSDGPLHGAQFGATVSAAINYTTNPLNLVDTAYHESWHFLERVGAFSKQEKALMDSETALLKKFMDQDDYLKDQDFDTLTSTKLGREELRANAFGKWAKQRLIDNSADKSLPSVFKAMFRRVLNFMTKLGNALRGMGFNSIDDIFMSAAEGERAIDAIQAANDVIAQARFQHLGENIRDVYLAEQDLTYKDKVKEARQASDQNTLRNGKTMGIYGRYLQSMAHAASNDPFLAQIYNSVNRRLLNASAYLNNYIDKIKDFQSAPKEVRYRLHELANFMRDSGQKAVLDNEGRLTFERDGRVVRLADKDASRQYMLMQAGYAEVLQDWENEIRRNAIKEFEGVLPNIEFTKEDIRKAQAALKESKETKDSDVMKRLGQLHNTLSDIDAMRSKDFVPHMRFGSWGIVVNDKEGSQVAFYTVESGSFKKLYDKWQLGEVQKELQEKYSDTSKYTIVGGAGTIKDLSNLDKIMPFKMTYSALKNNIDPRFLNIELLSGLINSKDLDIKEYEQLRKEVYDNILQRGFEKRFAEQKNIDGYSKDWDRVQHAYLTGASHYLSGLPHNEELSIIQKQATELKDDVLKEKAEVYLNYCNSPQEDYQMMRTFNFMWTMGGNVSTALLQVVTLPTTTLGAITQYNPNVVKNMMTIAKWSTLAKNFLPSTQFSDGYIQLDFANKDVWDKLIAKKKATPAMYEFMKKMHNYSRIRGMQTEEYSGYKPFETRSTGGSAKARASNIANMLGMPVSFMEQMTRFATTAAAFETLESADAQERAKKILAKDYRFQAQLQNQMDWTFTENAANFVMDEAHAVFGKLGRAEYMRGLGGALFFPFMTYPQQALEFMMRMANRGPDGLRGLATTLTALFLISGLMGLPGAELLKELIEELEKQITGTEEDLDFLIREKIYSMTGDARFAKFFTQGIGRAYGGMDISKRVGLPIPGQDILLSILGIKGEPSDILGVQGSLIGAVGQAWSEYNSGGGAVNIAAALTPVGASNVLKAVQYNQQGVRTMKGTQLVTPEDVSKGTIMSRALGVTSDQVASARELQYSKILSEGKYKTGIDRFRSKAKNIMTDMKQAQKDGDFEKAKQLQQEYKSVIIGLMEFGKSNQIPIDVRSFNKSVNQAAKQRLDPTVKPKDVKKIARKDVSELSKVLGPNN